MQQTSLIQPLVCLLVFAAPAAAQNDHTAMHRTDPAPAVLTEPGQGAFGALSEVVAHLAADPETDWPRVDVDALRARLVDMDLLVTRAEAVVENLPDGIRATATGDPATVAALGRMVPAHAAQLATDSSWTAEGQATADGAILTVASDDPGVVARIRALGFFGLTASQDHHRAHHLGIATGTTPYDH
ncbi:MAG: hypothetical protein ACU0CO_05360 [Shimia sp.]